MATPTFIPAAPEHDSLGSSSDGDVMTLPAFSVAAEFFINTMVSAAIAAPVDLSIGPVDKSSNHAASEEQTNTPGWMLDLVENGDRLREWEL